MRYLMWLHPPQKHAVLAVPTETRLREVDADTKRRTVANLLLTATWHGAVVRVEVDHLKIRSADAIRGWDGWRWRVRPLTAIRLWLAMLLFWPTVTVPTTWKKLREIRAARKLMGA